MDRAVCSRETERDYTWDNTHASPVLAEYAQKFFAPAFEGSITRSRFAALLRNPNSPQGVILCVSVSTNRRDFSRTPIRTLAVLRAEKPEEANLLASFFAECLRKPDAETLYAAESKIAKAVESLYQTKKPEDFLRYCRSLPTANDNGATQIGRREIPRDDSSSRQEMAESLPALIGSGSPFLVALTDRLPSDVLASLEAMFDHAIVHIFSKAVTAKAPLPGGVPNTRAIAAAIGGAVILVLLVAAGRSCGKAGGGSEPGGGTNIVSSASSSEGSSTNIPASSRNSATNALTPLGKSGESDGETWRDSFPTSTIPEEVEADPSVVKDVSSPTSPTDSPDKATDNRR